MGRALCGIGLLGLALTLGTACSEDASASTDEAESAWGHLNGLDPRPPQFLINKKAGESYRICMARYVADALVIHYGLVTHVPALYEIALRPAGSTVFTPLESLSLDSAAPAFDNPAMQLNIPLGTVASPRFTVRLQLAIQQPDGSYGKPRSLELEEEAPE